MTTVKNQTQTQSIPAVLSPCRQAQGKAGSTLCSAALNCSVQKAESGAAQPSPASITLPSLPGELCRLNVQAEGSGPFHFRRNLKFQHINVANFLLLFTLLHQLPYIKHTLSQPCLVWYWVFGTGAQACRSNTQCPWILQGHYGSGVCRINPFPFRSSNICALLSSCLVLLSLPGYTESAPLIFPQRSIPQPLNPFCCSSLISSCSADTSEPRCPTRTGSPCQQRSFQNTFLPWERICSAHAALAALSPWYKWGISHLTPRSCLCFHFSAVQVAECGQPPQNCDYFKARPDNLMYPGAKGP